MKIRKTIVTTALSALVCFGLSASANAVEPAAPDTALAGGNTADGQLALGGLTTGLYNSAFGIYALLSNADANFNTAVGAGVLLSNTASQNTAVGAGVLLSNTTGVSNTAVGTFALFVNSTGNDNTAVGDEALEFNVSSDTSTAVGTFAAQNNDSSGNGLADFNTAVGGFALRANVDGTRNTAVGAGAMESPNGGNDNTAIGELAGNALGGGSGNIDIGSGVVGVADENNTIRVGDNLPSGGIDVVDGGPAANFVLIGTGLNTEGISIGTLIGFSNVAIANGFSTTVGASSCNIGGIYNQPPTAGSHGVVVGPDNRLADATLSSRRFKKDIAPIDKMSEGILALRPVTFHWKNDNTNEPEFGLVAEDVAEVNLAWITRNPQGEISGVRYEAIPILLLNEFLKEHKKVEEQQANIAELKSTVGVLTARLKEQATQIERVSAQLQMSRPATKVAVGNQ